LEKGEIGVSDGRRNVLKRDWLVVERQGELALDTRRSAEARRLKQERTCRFGLFLLSHVLIAGTLLTAPGQCSFRTTDSARWCRGLLMLIHPWPWPIHGRGTVAAVPRAQRHAWQGTLLWQQAHLPSRSSLFGRSSSCVRLDGGGEPPSTQTHPNRSGPSPANFPPSPFPSAVGGAQSTTRFKGIGPSFRPDSLPPPWLRTTSCPDKAWLSDLNSPEETARGELVSNLDLLLRRPGVALQHSVLLSHPPHSLRFRFSLCILPHLRPGFPSTESSLARRAPPLPSRRLPRLPLPPLGSPISVSSRLGSSPTP
jgi:hypothetical protein